jgi:hypothetical protein
MLNCRFVNVVISKLVQCIVCYNAVTGPTIFAQCTRCQKGLITYFKASGITAMMKHVDVKHPNLAQKPLEKVSSMARGPLER